ncbi:MAG: hypothetical protein JXC33_12210 [Deltaproteobacteria bacterium]|nr:hypothetical protein [Deltaproteobacteria bacterium]
MKKSVYWWKRVSSLGYRESGLAFYHGEKCEKFTVSQSEKISCYFI